MPVPELESTRVEEEPHRLIHEVYRPVIQELKEVIQPYRKVVQQIQPVIEEVQQIISSSKGEVRAQPSPSTITNSAIKMPSMNLQSISSPYQSASTMYHDAIPRNLVLSDSPTLIKSMPRSQKNVGVPFSTKGIVSSPTSSNVGTLGRQTQSYFLMGQNMGQSSKNQNSFQNRYLGYSGALSGLKLDGTVRRLGLISHPQAEKMHTILEGPNGDYELYEIRVGTGQPVKDERSWRRNFQVANRKP